MGFFKGMDIRSYLQPIFSFKTQDMIYIIVFLKVLC